MTPDQAAWVRAHVLPRAVVDTERTSLHRCACQKDLSDPCRRGAHGDCAHHRLAAYYAQGEAETSMGRSYSPWSVCWPGFVGVDVWLADRVCRWQCPCDCHPRPEPARVEPPPEPEPEPSAYADGRLFDLAAS